MRWLIRNKLNIISMVVIFVCITIVFCSDLFEKNSFLLTVIGWFIAIPISYLVGHGFEMFINRPWKRSFKQLIQQGKICKENYPNAVNKIRISFAYLYRILIDDKYFLIFNPKTNKYQPVGGVYKLNESELMYVKEELSVSPDISNIANTGEEKMDYRKMVPVKNLSKFVKRFEKSQNRETIKDLSREFKEELLDSNNRIDRIQYRYCGRKYSDIFFDNHFSCYELQIFDVIELSMNPEIIKMLKELINKDSKKYALFSASQIKSLGIDISKEQFVESIGDHTIYTLNDMDIYLNKRFVKKNNTFTVEIKK